MLEINKNEDILVPFNYIGEEGWETKTRMILSAVADNWNREVKEPIAVEDIVKLERRLGTTLPNGLKFFYATFGLADIG